MKLRQSLRRILAAALCLMLCAGLAQPAWAASRSNMTIPIPGFNGNQDCALTLNYGSNAAGMTVKVYRVASINRNVRFTPEGVFKSYLKQVDLNKPSTFNWWTLAKDLEGEVTRNQVAAIQNGERKVGENGEVRFTMKPGLYLVVTDPLIKPMLDEKGGQMYDSEGKPRTVVYTTTPYLVSLPTWIEDAKKPGGGDWVWDLRSNVEKKVVEEEQKLINVQVQKTWLDENGKPTENHPARLTIELYRGSELYKTITLPHTTAEGKTEWRYQWTGLDNAQKWSVVEHPQGGWTNVGLKDTVGLDGSHYFALENQKVPNRPEPPSGGDPTEPVHTTPQPTPTPGPDATPTPGADVTPTPGIDVTPTPGPDVTPTPGPNVTPTPNPEPTPTPGTTPPPAQSNPPRPSTPPPLEEIEIDDPGTPLGPPPPDQDPPDGPEEIELDDPDTPLGDLPQTGQLWWPVPVLAIAGMFLFLIGWALRRRDGYDEE